MELYMLLKEATANPLRKEIFDLIVEEWKWLIKEKIWIWSSGLQSMGC